MFTKHATSFSQACTGVCMCVRTDMCADARAYPPVFVCVPRASERFVDICMDMCMGTWTDICTDESIDVCRGHVSMDVGIGRVTMWIGTRMAMTI